MGRAVHIQPIAGREVVQAPAAKQHRAGPFGEAAAAEGESAAGEAAADAHGDVAEGGDDLQKQPGLVALEPDPPGGGVDRHGDGEGLAGHVHRGGRDCLLGEGAAAVDHGEDDPVGGEQAGAGEGDALPGVGRGDAVLRGGAAGGGGGDAGQAAAARAEALDAEDVGPAAGGAAAARGLGVVAGVAGAADAEVVGAARRGGPKQRGGAAGGVALRGQLRAVGVEHAQAGGRAAEAEGEAVAGVEANPVQIHVAGGLDAVAQRGAQRDPVVGGQRQRLRGGEAVADVGRRGEVGVRRRRHAALERGRAAGGADGDGAAGRAGRHRDGQQLLVAVAAAAVGDGAHAEAACGAAADADRQFVGCEAAAFEHQGAAGGSRAADGAQGRHHLKAVAGPAAEHGDDAAAGQGGHGDGQCGAAAADAAGAGDDTGRAGVVHALELHQRAAGEALALQDNGLAGVGAGLGGVGGHADGGGPGDAGEQHCRLGRGRVAGKFGVAAFGGDANRPVQRLDRHGAESVVAGAGDVEGAEVGGRVRQRDAADGDGDGAFHEAGALQGEHAVLARAAAEAGERGDDLQPDAGAGAEALRVGGAGVVGEGLAQQADAVDADIEQVGAVGSVAAAVPGVENVEVEAEAVGLPGGEADEVQRLAAAAEAS